MSRILQEEQDAYLGIITHAEDVVAGLLSRCDEDSYPDASEIAEDILSMLDGLRAILGNYWEEAEVPEPYYSLAEPPH